MKLRDTKRWLVTSLMGPIWKGYPSYRAPQASVIAALETNFLCPVLPHFFIVMYLPKVTPSKLILSATFHQCFSKEPHLCLLMSWWYVLNLSITEDTLVELIFVKLLMSIIFGSSFGSFYDLLGFLSEDPLSMLPG